MLRAIKAETVRLLHSAPWGGQWCGGRFDAGLQMPERQFDTLIALRDVGLVKIVQGYCLGQFEHVLGQAVADQRIASGDALHRTSRYLASSPALRSPATMARMIFMPVAPVTSCTT